MTPPRDEQFRLRPDLMRRLDETRCVCGHLREEHECSWLKPKCCGCDCRRFVPLNGGAGEGVG